MIPSRDAVHSLIKKNGFKLFEGGDRRRDFDMNLIGLRTMPGTTNKFDDWMTLSFLEKGQWQFYFWPITTEPGGKYLTKPMNPGVGTAVLHAPDQYPGVYKVGTHSASKPWAHEALVQVGDFRVCHDNNRDQIIDYNLAITTSHGTSGINIHRDLGDFSAGCQVFQFRQDHTNFMTLVKKQIIAGMGDTFTYTLLEWPL